MNIASLGGHAIDCCPRCAGVFLDAHEGSALGVDFALLFGFGARPVGASSRSCPDHQQPMTRFSIKGSSGGVEVDRAACCGGVFLDAGEAQDIGEPALPAAAAAQVPATTGAGKRLVCPDCGNKLAHAVKHEFSVEECVSCNAIFYDGGEPEKAGIETSALFADTPWGATKVGQSEKACPACHTPMTTYRVSQNSKEFEVEFAPCCRGVFVHPSDEAPLRFAARRALYARADAEYESGQTVTAQKSMSTPEELRRVQAGQVHAQAAEMRGLASQVRMLQSKVRRHRRRDGDWYF